MTPARAQRQEELLSDCTVSPEVFDHMVDRLRDLDQRAHLHRNIRLCVTLCMTISCMVMEKRGYVIDMILNVL